MTSLSTLWSKRLHLTSRHVRGRSRCTLLCQKVRESNTSLTPAAFRCQRLHLTLRHVQRRPLPGPCCLSLSTSAFKHTCTGVHVHIVVSTSQGVHTSLTPAAFPCQRLHLTLRLVHGRPLPGPCCLSLSTSAFNLKTRARISTMHIVVTRYVNFSLHGSTVKRLTQRSAYV